MIHLALPYPPSANRYWRPINLPNGRHIFAPTKEAKAFKAATGWIAREAGIRTPIIGRIELAYALHPRLPLDWRTRARKDPDGWEDTVMCIDLDNAQKVLLDSLKGVVFEDDKWVRKITAQRGQPMAEACLQVWVATLKTAAPVQTALELTP